jgi:putative NADH-flavin reductase
MKLLVIGATGGTGRELLKQSLDQGQVVTAFARDPARLLDIEHENLRLVSGDVLNRARVESAMSGQDAVLVSIGAGARRSTIREDGTRNVIAAMNNADVRRLLCLSSLGVGDSRSNLGLFTRYIVVGVFLRHAFADHERQEALVKQSTLDWTIVRPPHLKNGPLTGVYHHGFSTTDRNIKSIISRADVADFMLKQLDDDSYIRRTPGISY